MSELNLTNKMVQGCRIRNCNGEDTGLTDSDQESNGDVSDRTKTVSITKELE